MILGIDLGTSVVKAAAFAGDGEVLAVEGRRVNLYNPRPEYSEQDIDETLDALGEVVRTVVEGRTSTSRPSASPARATGCGSWTRRAVPSGAP